MKRPGLPSPPAARGAVLIVVLWVCLGLVSMVLLFGHAMLMNYRGADDEVAGCQADQAIEGAANYAESILTNVDTPGLFPDPTSYENEAVPVGEAAFWMIGRPQDTENGTERTYGLIDEASKINLNTATLDILNAIPGMTPDVAASILNWRSTNGTTSPGGADSSTYGSMQPPYAIKNGLFESVGELALIAGTNPVLLFGEDANLNGFLDPNEDDGDKNPPADNSDGKLDPGVYEYVTAFSQEPNVQSSGAARLDVTKPNTALYTFIGTILGTARAGQIRQRVGTNPRPPIASVLDFYVRGQMTADEFGLIYDGLTASSGKFATGLINANTASATVLSCLPGITPDLAANMVTARLSRATQDANIAWVADTIGSDAVRQAGAYLTGRSYQVTADIAAVGRHGRGYRRSAFVIDNSTGTPRIIYRRNLAPLGFALYSQARQGLPVQTVAQ